MDFSINSDFRDEIDLTAMIGDLTLKLDNMTRHSSLLSKTDAS